MDWALADQGIALPKDTRVCLLCGSKGTAAVCDRDGGPTEAWKPWAGLPWRPGITVDNRYELRGLLGRGGHGAVFEAWDQQLLRTVAIKLLQRGDDARHLRRFRREVEALANVRHPSLVEILESGTSDDGSTFLVMEHVAGVSLQAQLEQGTLPGGRLDQNAAIELGVCVLAGLEAAHGAGIIHRDIKPGNIMVCAPGGATPYKVIDFGLARSEGSSVITENAVGTPAYMSPEQCSADVIDSRSDQYALALVLYRCVAGCLPWGDLPGARAMFAHVHEPPRDLRAVPGVRISDGFATVVMTALARDPEGRFRSAAHMAAALRRCAPQPQSQISDTPLAVQPVTRGAAPRKWAGRQPWAVAVAALFAVVGVGAVRADFGGARAQTPAPSAVVSPAPVGRAPLPAPSAHVTAGAAVDVVALAAVHTSATVQPSDFTEDSARTALGGALPTQSARPAAATRPKPALRRHKSTELDPYSVLPSEE